MKTKLLLAFALALAFLAGTIAPSLSAQVPTKLFDVRNGNGLTLDGTTYNRATVIVFKDNTSKDAVIDAFALMRGYQATVGNDEQGQPIPNPQSKQAFFNAELTRYIRETYKAAKVSAAERAAKATAETAADAELPPRQLIHTPKEEL